MVEKSKNKWYAIPLLPFCGELVEVEDSEGKRQFGWYEKEGWQFGIRRVGPVVKWRKPPGQIYNALNLE